MVKEDVFYKKFVAIITKLGGWDESATISDRSAAQLKRYARGDDPPLSVIQKLCEASDLSISWLLSAEVDLNGTPAKFADNGHSYEKKHYIPQVDISGSTGGTELIFEKKESESVNFSKNWLNKNGLTAPDLFIIENIGEAMSPNINAGDLLLCSTAEQHRKVGDGLYLIRLEGSLLVKRTQVLPGKRLKITSDNSSQFSPYEIELNDGVEFSVLGKVVYTICKRF